METIELVELCRWTLMILGLRRLVRLSTSTALSSTSAFSLMIAKRLTTSGKCRLMSLFCHPEVNQRSKTSTCLRTLKTKLSKLKHQMQALDLTTMMKQLRSHRSIAKLFQTSTSYGFSFLQTLMTSSRLSTRHLTRVSSASSHSSAGTNTRTLSTTLKS